MIVVSDTDGNKHAMFDFLKSRGVLGGRSEDFQAIGRVERRDGAPRLIGVVGYNGFTGKTASIHCAGEGNWVSRELIHQTFKYPFVQLGLKVLIAPVAANNLRSMRFVRKMGFDIAYRLVDGWADGVDLVLHEMRAENCRWIDESMARKAA